MLTLSVYSLLCSVALVGCSRIDERNLIGAWRHEDEDGIGEMTLGADHSYHSIQSFKQELTTPSVIEDIGSWRLVGNHVEVESTVTWSKERSKFSMPVAGVTRDVLRLYDPDAKKTVVFARFAAPECVVRSSSTAQSDLHGTWDFHYHTHDYRYSFASDGHVTLSGLMSGEWSLIREGQWQLSGATLTIRERAVRGSSNEQEVKWTLSGIGADCLTFNDGSATYALKRASTQ